MTSAFSTYPRCCLNNCTRKTNPTLFVCSSGSAADRQQQPVYTTTTNADASDINYTHVYNVVKENGYNQYDTTAPPQSSCDSFTGRQSNSENQQRSTTASEENCICKNLLKKSSSASNKMSDRLGQWPTESDSEIAGNLSGLDRLRNGRYNKVSGKFFFRYKIFRERHLQ